MGMRKFIYMTCFAILGFMSQAKAQSWSGFYYVDQIASHEGTDMQYRSPGELIEVALSNGQRFAFWNRGPQQDRMLSLLTSALTQGKQVSVYKYNSLSFREYGCRSSTSQGVTTYVCNEYDLLRWNAISAVSLLSP
jgi:hypothetical protein